MAADRIVIVGAGMAGASTAFALARRGVAVTVVDDGRVGQATAAGAGIVAPWSGTETGRFYDLYAAGAAFYPHLIDRLAAAGFTDTDYRVTGALVVSADPAELDRAEGQIRGRLAAAGAGAGTAVRLSPAQARERVPVLAADLAAVLMTGGARVDGRHLRDALLAAAERLGAERRAGTAGLGREGDRLTVTVDGEPVPARSVVVAGGAWADRLLAGTGHRVGTEPQRGQITHLQLHGVDTTAWPTVLPLADHYLVPFDGGRVVVGATRETDAGFDPRVTAAGQQQVLADALATAPGLAEATLIETRVGLRPRPTGGRPVIGPLGGSAHASVITGFGACGLTLGPLAGDALARQLLGDPAPEIDGFAPAGPVRDAAETTSRFRAPPF